MTLDTLCQVLKTECCWIQTVDTRQRVLSLAAYRGFSPEMKHEITRMDTDHRFSQQIIGLGNEVVIPDLANDGLYGLSSFREAGFKWLVAAPLMTYRVHGILGIASRKKKRFYKQTSELTKVIAGLIGTALNKAWLAQKPAVREKPAPAKVEKTPENEAVPQEEKLNTNEQPDSPAPAPDKPSTKTTEGTFHKHARKMKSFRSSHR
jgi:signal transduction protein with GAF and PtsI domain